MHRDARMATEPVKLAGVCCINHFRTRARKERMKRSLFER
jgi:hypothetical protein